MVATLIEALGFLVDMANFNRQQVPVGSQPDFRRRFAGRTEMQRPQVGPTGVSSNSSPTSSSR